jgi:hypothetical protein
MRSGSWLLICLWLLKWSLTLGMGLTTLSASSSAAFAEHKAHTAQPSAAHLNTPQASHTTSAHAGHDECHGHSDAQTEAGHGEDLHCTAHGDCHHCCPLGWGHGSGMALHPVPTLHPAGLLTAWHSASWVPDLRPPIA